MDYALAQPLPFHTALSLEPLIDWWRARAAEPPGTTSLGPFAATLVRRLERAPELLGVIEDLTVLRGRATLVETLMMALMPPAAVETSLIGAVAPFEREVLFATPRFRQVMVNATGQLKQPLNLSAAETNFYLTRFAYLLILDEVYGVRVPREETIIFTVPDYELGLYRHYKVELDSRFMQVLPRGKLPVLSSDDKHTLVSSLRDLGPWLDKLPPSCFELRGFTLLHLTDVTEQQVLSTLKNDLLARDVLLASDRLEQLQEQLRSLFRLPSLRLGLMGYVARKNQFVTFGQRLGQASLCQQLEDPDDSGDFRTLFERLVQTREPLVIEDVRTEAGLPEPLREKILGIGIQNAILCLLLYGDDVLGVLELASPEAGALTTFSLEKITQFLPLFAVAVHRHHEMQEARVQAIVKEKFTAIHPALEWRFVEAAEDLLAQQARGVAQPELQPIVFQEVYPLYGAVDVRGSSVARAEAVKNDLMEHLHLANRVLNGAASLQPLPIVEELSFYVRKHLLKLRDGVAADDEVTILDTLRNEVEPLFEYLHATTPALRPAIQRYWQALDPVRGILYRQRKAFEDSMTRLNERISDLLEVEEARAQQMYPHYFRKSVTDGVEFDIYVGASLVENRPFDQLFLKNLRLWQLLLMVRIAQLTQRLKQELPVPLGTTQLILVNGQPLAVRFRQDERQFDVDGAWNARYEIIKKRIDKATIVGTGERLTQPGAIALVYQQAREAQEYAEYLDYLRERNLLLPDTEHLELEEAQGVRGLMALRVWVKYDD